MDSGTYITGYNSELFYFLAYIVLSFATEALHLRFVPWTHLHPVLLLLALLLLVR